MNGQLELRIITQPYSYSAVYWGYFRRLVFLEIHYRNILYSAVFHIP